MSALRRLNAFSPYYHWFAVVARRWAEVHARGVGVLRRIEQLDGRTNRHEPNQFKRLNKNMHGDDPFEGRPLP